MASIETQGDVCVHVNLYQEQRVNTAIEKNKRASSSRVTDCTRCVFARTWRDVIRTFERGLIIYFYDHKIVVWYIICSNLRLKHDILFQRRTGPLVCLSHRRFVSLMVSDFTADLSAVRLPFYLASCFSLCLSRTTRLCSCSS